jgi:uncharacterized membrane protein
VDQAGLVGQYHGLRRWPVLSFWQATADGLAARLVPDGHGHRYGAELEGAWRRLAPPGNGFASSTG